MYITNRGAAREVYHFRPKTFELALKQQQQEGQQQQGKKQQPAVSRAEEASDDFQEVGTRKRPRGRPPAFAAIQEEVARDPRQGRLNFAKRVDTVPVRGGRGAPASDQEMGEAGG
ncbi:hypothetical protein C8A05DRAFT_16795 [Staphylotrichum tortipilum]|uniref:Uncharacterized protein n=1 Tax=Staphylotrichum tortipilum TaxID=2831512 RepID=A0AAN6MJF0_9PEZI|nr:hypothetical protein C8A05DRAFT_16795 [Staphylotrichum longicolle]